MSCTSCGRINKGEAAVDTLRQDTIVTQSDSGPQQALQDISLPGMEIIEELGTGGFGAVYRVRQKQLGREVAVKILHASHNIEDDEGRFLSEAIITGNLQHPNIVPVHELGKDNHGRQFFSMKIANGELLSDIINLLNDTDLNTTITYTAQRLLHIFIDICDAVGYAHQQGIIHRDLKPNNIMIGEFGQVYVLDWGLAKVKDSVDQIQSIPQSTALAKARLGVESKLTRAGTVMGTPGYMSPEQADGRLDELNEASDIFSLGVILYELMCLRLPIQGEKIHDVINHTIKGKFKPFSMALIQPFAEAELSAICTRAMALNPKRRYHTIEELIGDIQGILNDRDISVYRSPMLHRILRWTRKNRGKTISLSATLSVCVIGLLGFSLSSAQFARERARNAESENMLTQQAELALREQLKAEAAKSAQEHELRLQQERNNQAHKLYIDAIDLASRPGNWAKAVALIDQALLLNPDYIDAIFTRAHIYRNIHAYEKSLADCEIANRISIRINGHGYAHALNIAGDIWRDRTDDKADMQKALEFYQLAAVLDPDNPYVQFSKVFIQYIQQGSTHARAAAEEVVAAHPDYWEAYYLLGYLYLGADQDPALQTNMPDYHLCIKNYSIALKLQPTQAKLYQNRGYAYLQLYLNSEIKSSSHLKAGLKDFEIAAALDPNNPLVWRNLLRIYYEVVRDYEHSLLIVDQLEPLLRNQSNYNLHATRAYCYEGLKDYAKALEAIKHALIQSPQDDNFLKFKRDMEAKLDTESAFEAPKPKAAAPNNDIP